MFELPPTHFAPVRAGVRLAYQVVGDGPHTLVSVPPTAQNIEVCWEHPAIRAMLERFASFSRFLHFDKHGTGCSDRTGQVADIDARVDELRAVMDHAGIGRAHLLGNSEGGPMSLLFAATYPERVAGVVLVGSGAALFPPGMTDAEVEQRREGHRRYAAVWGTPSSPVAAGFAPTLTAQDPGFAAWHQRYERLAASQDSLFDLLELSLTMDVREILPHLDVPVLLVHRTGDRVFPVERARETAAALPNARLVEQPGQDHFGYSGDVAGWMDEVERFVTGGVRSRAAATTTVARVAIHTLGRFAVQADGVEVPTAAWGSRLARQLCKRLVAARGWPVTRDELFSLLWPDELDRRRLGPRLSVQLSTVRKILHGGVIADRESIRLDLDAVSTDLERLHRAGDDDTVVAAYTGTFLPDDIDEPWTEGTRAEAAARFGVAARRVASTAIAQGDASVAVGLTTRLLDDDPYDLEAHRLLVAALLDAGADRHARRAHDRWRSVTDELGLPPPPPVDAGGA